jgi:hypothetical protein
MLKIAGRQKRMEHSVNGADADVEILEENLTAKDPEVVVSLPIIRDLDRVSSTIRRMLNGK